MRYRKPAPSLRRIVIGGEGRQLRATPYLVLISALLSATAMLALLHTPARAQSGPASSLPVLKFTPDPPPATAEAKRDGDADSPAVLSTSTTTSSDKEEAGKVADGLPSSASTGKQQDNSPSASAGGAVQAAEPEPKRPNRESLQPSLTSAAAPEVTPAQTLSSSTSESGKAIAQAAGGTRPKATLPAVTGTVKIRRPFKLFAREELIHNLSFRDTPVKEVIAELARRGNLNIIIDKSVVGRITGELRDLTLNEAMDSVLAAAGLQSRTLDNNTAIIGSLQAMTQLGLNRPVGRVFKLSYAHPYDVATLLHASFFNRGYIPDFTAAIKRKGTSDKEETSESSRMAQGEHGNEVAVKVRESDRSTDDLSNDQINRPDIARTVRGTSRAQTQEGVGFNNAAVDPGTQQIRAFQEIPADYIVEQNGGNAIVIPDVKNRQVLVVGTVHDLEVAEEAIRLIDHRPRQVHIQTSLVELTNQGIRQLSMNVSSQGQGLSGSVLGNSAAPLVRYLPGLGGQSNSNAGSGTTFNSNASLDYAGLIPFTTGSQTTTFTQNNVAQTPNSVTNFPPANPFTGLVGSVLPTVAQTIAGVSSTPTAASGFNLLTLARGAGGAANIATMPAALNLSLNLLLQTNKAKIIANPSVVVVDNTESLITLAQEVVHKVTSTVSLGVVTTNVELTKAGIFLNVLPKVAEDGFITMRLRPQVSTPLGAPLVFGNPNTNPTIVTLLNIRDIMSQEVRVKDGQTLVIGGLFTENEAAVLAKVPYLAETPILGALFRNSLKGRNRTEL
ncbi:MAG TPA: hypothetical protein V6D17_11530, partial [Candidatus Obscuribacterales bacterium]